SNKKRPEDSKTCPYYQQLDELYQKKILGSSSGVGGGSTTLSFISPNRLEEQQQQPQESISLALLPTTKQPDRSDAPAIMPGSQPTQGSETQNKNGRRTEMQPSNADLPGSLLGEGNGEAAKKVNFLFTDHFH